MTAAFTTLDPAARPNAIEPALRRMSEGCVEQLRPWLEGLVRDARDDLTRSPARGRLVMDRAGEPCGVVTWTPLRDAEWGSAVFVGVLDPTFEGPEFCTLLAGLAPAGPEVGRMLRVNRWPPAGERASAWTAALRALGFQPRSRVDCTFELARLGALPRATGGLSARPLRLEDEDRIAELMLAAYADAPAERALFAQLREPRAEALLGTHDLIHGEVGTWRPEASFGIHDGPRLAAASMVQEHHGWLISEVMVGPEFRRRGYGAHVIASSIRALAAASPGGSVRLVVSRENERAFRLYQKLGFQPDLATDGVSWVRPALFSA